MAAFRKGEFDDLSNLADAARLSAAKQRKHKNAKEEEERLAKLERERQVGQLFADVSEVFESFCNATEFRLESSTRRKPFGEGIVVCCVGKCRIELKMDSQGNVKFTASLGGYAAREFLRENFKLDWLKSEFKTIYPEFVKDDRFELELASRRRDEERLVLARKYSGFYVGSLVTAYLMCGISIVCAFQGEIALSLCSAVVSELIYSSQLTPMDSGYFPLNGMRREDRFGGVLFGFLFPLSWLLRGASLVVFLDHIDNLCNPNLGVRPQPKSSSDDYDPPQTKIGKIDKDGNIFKID